MTFMYRYGSNVIVYNMFANPFTKNDFTHRRVIDTGAQRSISRYVSKLEEELLPSNGADYRGTPI